MKKFLTLILFLFATNLYSLCYLTSVYDSLYFKPSNVKTVGIYDIISNLKLDENVTYDSTTCDSFFISIRGSSVLKGGSYTDKDSSIIAIYINGYVYETGFILKKVYVVKYKIRNRSDTGYSIDERGTRIDYDTVLNYRKPIKVERKSIIDSEKILSVSIYDIRGRLVAIRNDSKFNNLQGFYVFQYITDKRTYTQKKYFIK